ncbi:polysaccharide deacetylase family protein [Reichenbachiella sp.]|uniref:polysaccharide deacetylase family protein n=1 Tax=Reichenbachiella sp. TaxID=2184521 RepID=UPI003B5AE156
MGFYFHRIPRIFQYLFPRQLWHVPNFENKIFLTFDDGPTPEVTDFVLSTLQEYSVKATFFLLGEQLENHIELAKRMRAFGHQLANHGYKHLDGKELTTNEYFANKNKGQDLIKTFNENPLFRPPYGWFKRSDRTVVWSLMAGDFDGNLNKEKCLAMLKTKTRVGDIVVFHDNEKSFDKLKWVLPRYLQFCVDQGFQFDLIPQEL